MWVFKSNLSKDKFISDICDYNEKYLKQLKNEYDELKNEPIEELSYSSFIKFSQTGDRIEYEAEYFHRRKMLRDFALTAWLYNDIEALALLENVMWAVCNEFTWVLPAHLGENIFNGTIDLFAAETAQTLTEIISLMKDKLSQSVVERCLGEVYKRVLNPFLERNKPYNWENMRNNWCGVCGGCIGMIIIYLVENDEYAKQLADKLRTTMESYIESFSNDGACLEGLYYWNYGMMYFTAFIDLYKQRFGVDYNICFEKTVKMADFSHKCCMGDGVTISFSDGFENDRVYSGLVCKLHDMYLSKIPEEEYFFNFDGDDCGRWCKAVRDVAWTYHAPKEYLQSSHVFEEAQWAVLKNGSVSVAFKGGNNNEPHNHNDIGNIMVVKNGNVLLCDLGAGEYTAEYFSKNRYDIFCNGSAGHSVPIVNGNGQCVGDKYAASEFFSDDTSASAEISGAYNDNGIKSCKRSIRAERDCIEVCDYFVGTAKITERFITRCEAVNKNGIVLLMKNGEEVGRLICENSCEIAVHSHNEHDGKISKVYTVDFCFKVNGEYNFSLKIM